MMIIPKLDRIQRIGIALALSGILAGCAGPFRSSRVAPEMDRSLLVGQIQRHVLQLQTFQGWARWVVNSPERSFSGVMQMAVKLPDSLWIKVEGPFGVDMVSASLGGGQILLYSPWINTVFKGPIQNLHMNKVVPIEVDASRMVFCLLGLLVPDSCAADSLGRLSTEKGRYVLDLGKNEQMWVDSKGPVVTRWEKRDSTGSISWIWEGKGFKVQGKIRMPKVVRITQFQPNQQMTLFYEKIKTNQPMRNGWSRIKIPEGAKSVEL